MTLEIFKSNIKSGRKWLTLLMSLIFISAGVFRILNPEAAKTELLNLGIPVFLTWVLAFFEIVGGTAMLCGGKIARMAFLTFIVFLLFALAVALTVNGAGIIAQAGELFVFNTTATDFFLHFVFIIIMFSLLLDRHS